MNWKYSWFEYLKQRPKSPGRHQALVTALVILSLMTVLCACRPVPPPRPPVTDKVGQPAELEDVYGIFYAYVPTSLAAAPEIAVLVHGTPAEESGQDTAHYYLVTLRTRLKRGGFF
jgi:hypothetical protein